MSIGGEAPVVYIVSDSLGETAELVTRAAASQFGGEGIRMHRFPYVTGKSHLEQVVAEAEGKKSVIAYTLVMPELRDYLVQLAARKKIPTVDILGPMVNALTQVCTTSPYLEPGLLRRLDDQYFRRVEAIEFAVKYDDGKGPQGIISADLVLVGVSRTSKTPVCMYLAHRNIRAANVPLVPEVAPPEELFWISPRKIVGLTISPQSLARIRRERLKSLGLADDAGYADPKRITLELAYAEEVMQRLKCPVVDVTDRAVEETAHRILEIYEEEKSRQNG